MRQKPVARYATLLFSLLLSISVLLVGLSMLCESSIDLKAAKRNYGVIASQKVGKDFSFTLAGSPTAYNVYRASRSYDDLRSILTIGDTVTIYAVNSATANLQVGQIEKNGQVVIDKQLLEGQNRAGAIIALLGGLGIIGVSVWQFKRNKVLR